MITIRNAEVAYKIRSFSKSLTVVQERSDKKRPNILIYTENEDK